MIDFDSTSSVIENNYNIRRATHEHYRDLHNMGYEWQTNIITTEFGDTLRDLLTNGHEIHIGSKAFNGSGELIPNPNFRSILVKK